MCLLFSTIMKHFTHKITISPNVNLALNYKGSRDSIQNLHLLSVALSDLHTLISYTCLLAHSLSNTIKGK